MSEYVKKQMNYKVINIHIKIINFKKTIDYKYTNDIKYKKKNTNEGSKDNEEEKRAKSKRYHSNSLSSNNHILL